MAAEAAPQLAYGGLTSAACRSRLRRSAAAAMAAAARALASRASRASRCSLAFRPPRRPRFRSGSSGARGGGGGGNSKSDSPSEQEKNCSMSDICKRGQEKEKKHKTTKAEWLQEVICVPSWPSPAANRTRRYRRCWFIVTGVGVRFGLTTARHRKWRLLRGDSP